MRQSQKPMCSNSMSSSGNPAAPDVAADDVVRLQRLFAVRGGVVRDYHPYGVAVLLEGLRGATEHSGNAGKLRHAAAQHFLCEVLRQTLVLLEVVRSALGQVA